MQVFIALTLTDLNLFKTVAVCSHFLLLKKERFIQYRDDIELILFVRRPYRTAADGWLIASVKPC
jgi:hypothetical protein